MIILSLVAAHYFYGFFHIATKRKNYLDKTV